MTIRIWQSGALAVSQVSRATLSTTSTGYTYRLTCNGKDVSYTSTVSGGSTAQAAHAIALAAAWEASTVPEHGEIAAAATSSYVDLTGNTAGWPHTITSTSTGCAMTTPTAATGPNHVDNADNWSGDAVPVATDDVVLENSDADMLHGLDQSAVKYNSYSQRQSYTGNIGLPTQNAAGYAEYRDTYFQFEADNVYIGEAGGNGSPRTKINTGSTPCTVSIYNTGTPAETGLPALFWKGNSTGNLVDVVKGKVGIGYFADDTAKLNRLRIGKKNNPTADASVEIGTGTTFVTIEQTAGKMSVNSSGSAFATLDQTGGESEIRGSGAITTVTVDGGICYYCSSGTASTVNIGSKGTIDCTRDLRDRTFTACNAFGGATVRDPHKTINFAGGINLQRCGLLGVTLDIGEHIKVTPGSI
jgi:hypothetical protein